MFFRYTHTSFYPVQILVKLVPFAALTTIVLVVFAFMFFVDRYGYPVDDVSGLNYETLWDSFLSVFSSFVGDPPNAENWLDILYGIVIVIVLLNVVIAIVSQQWEDATDQASKTFWQYRLDFLQEIRRKYDVNERSDDDQASPDNRKSRRASLDNLGPDDTENPDDLPLFYAVIAILIRSEVERDQFKEKFLEDSAPLWSRILHHFIWVSFFVAGIFSFGWFWPAVIRKQLFGSDRKISSSSRESILQEVNLVDKRIYELEMKMDQVQQSINEANTNMRSLTGKLDSLLENVRISGNK